MILRRAPQQSRPVAPGSGTAPLEAVSAGASRSVRRISFKQKIDFFENSTLLNNGTSACAAVDEEVDVQALLRAATAAEAERRNKATATRLTAIAAPNKNALTLGLSKNQKSSRPRGDNNV